MHSFGTLGRTADSANSRIDRPQVWASVLGTGKGAESSHENLHSKCHGRALRTRTNMKVSCLHRATWVASFDTIWAICEADTCWHSVRIYGRVPDRLIDKLKLTSNVDLV